MVDNVKHDKEVSISYMKIYERERMIRNEGRSEGFKEGRNEGIIEGREEGQREKLRELVQKKLAKGKSIPEIAEDLEEDAFVIEQILATGKS